MAKTRVVKPECYITYNDVLLIFILSTITTVVGLFSLYVTSMRHQSSTQPLQGSWHQVICHPRPWQQVKATYFVPFGKDQLEAGAEICDRVHSNPNNPQKWPQ